MLTLRFPAVYSSSITRCTPQPAIKSELPEAFAMLFKAASGYSQKNSLNIVFWDYLTLAKRLLFVFLPPAKFPKAGNGNYLIAPSLNLPKFYRYLPFVELKEKRLQHYLAI